ncbi:MAG TPA: hypothetical protein VJ917_09970 [Saprospiraceae bacterium]|nr:hypothetical protein [Saprospiraceae bacterium]
MRLFLWTGLLMTYSVFSHAQPCAGVPKFLEARGFEPGQAALSTSERRQMGLVLLSVGSKEGENASSKSYAHPSWDDQGYLSSITRDRQGHIYVAPKPNVNMLHTPRENLNTIFRVHAQNETMAPFQKLPGEVQISNENPYGILGLHYDCLTDHLLVSTVNGSTQQEEDGKVYAINTNTREVMPLVNHLDILGLAVVPIDGGQFQLLLASARESLVFALPVDIELRVIGPAQPVISLEGLGPRGDDRGRKMEYVNNQLIIYGTPFYFNLSAPTIPPETQYIFSRDESSGKWVFLSLR